MTDSDRGRWRWITIAVVLAIHDRQLAEHGGAEGIRDLASIDSALGRPVNLWAYGDPDIAELAASYAHGLVSSRGFVDGDKGTAWVVARLFLLDNGYRMKFDPFDAIRAVEGLASNQMSEAEFANWIRTRLVH